MTSTCVQKLPHICGTKAGLQVYQQEDGSFDGYCFACNSYVADPYDGNPPSEVEVKKRSEEWIAEQIREIDALPFYTKTIRHLRPETLEYFGIKIGLSEQDGETPQIAFFPYPGGYKAATLEAPKMSWWISTQKDNTLFAWNQAIGSGARTLFITEGEWDAPSLYQALRDNQKGGKWEHLIPAVVSLRNGAGSAHKGLGAVAQEIRSHFKDAVLVFDMDEPGQAAVQRCMKVLPTARSVSLPAKDANDCLKEGRAKALCNAVLFRSAIPKNSRIVLGSSLHQAAREVPKWGLSWPWAQLTDLTRGIRFGETAYWGAGVKMGKSELVNTLAAHAILEHGLKVFMAKPEEANVKTYKLVCGKATGKFFHDPKREFDFDAYDKASALVGDSLYMLDLYQHVDYNSLRADILEAINLGCKIIFIDPITNLINGVPSGEANTVLQGIAQDLAAISKDQDVFVNIFCHLKAPEAGPAHERGGKVLSHQFAGSRAMMRSCNYMFGLEGNKDDTLDARLRNTRRLVILEDREFGSTGAIDLYWDQDTGLFNEIKG